MSKYLRMYSDTLDIIPVGWGFLAINTISDTRSTITIVTDGGALSHRKRGTSCFLKSSKSTYRFNSPWVWVLSHLDYDHFSITLSMIKQRLWNIPSVIILPASYVYRECREAQVYLHALMEVVAFVQKISPPKSVEILSLLDSIRKQGKTKIIGVASRTVLKAGYLKYYFVWPEPNYVVAQCKELREAIREKIGQLCKGDKRCLDIYQEVLESLWTWVKETGEISYYENELIDINALLESHFQEPYYSNYLSLDFSAEGAIGIKEFFAEASSKLKDITLYILVSRVLNQHSTAYVIYSEKSALAEAYYDNRPRLYIPNYCESNAQIFYPSDLGNNELDLAIQNARKIYRCPITTVAVAPHHGNEYSRYWDTYIKPLVTFIPRCDLHTPPNYIKKYTYLRYYSHNIALYSGHSLGLKLLF